MSRLAILSKRIMSKHIHLLPAPKQRRVQFPQFIRFIPATSSRIGFVVVQKVVLWSLIICLVLVNAILIEPRLKTRLLVTTNNILIKLSAKNLTTLMRPEKKTNVLGVSSDQDMVTNLKNQQGSLEKEYAYWQSVVIAHPDYRDGYYTLALLAYELRRIPEARVYVQKVAEIDPNYQGLAKLTSLLHQEETR